MAAITNFHWDPIDDCVTHETDSLGNIQVIYTYEPGIFGALLSENRSGTEYYHHYDPLGSTTALTDDSGSVTDTFTYDAWGNVVDATGSILTVYQWVGRWGYRFDTPTNAYYVRARTYQTTIARWSSIDPMLKMRLEYPYILVANSPLNLIDPGGLDFIAVADRGVTNTFEVFWHYSAQKWQCCTNMPVGAIFQIWQIPQFCSRRRAVYDKGCNCKVDQRELLRKTGFAVWAWLDSESGDGPSILSLDEGFRGVAVVMNSDTSYRVMPVFDGPTKLVDAKWKEVLARADEYAFAEHWNASSGVFQNWPKSYYYAFGTNSNTFVRYILGSLMDEMPGRHPGAMSPSQNTPPYNWSLILGQTPFPASGPIPPRP